MYASIGTVLFFTVVTLLEGRPSAVAAVVAAKFWPTLIANYAIWPLAHLINFKFVAPQYRIAVSVVEGALTASGAMCLQMVTQCAATVVALLLHAHTLTLYYQHTQNTQYNNVVAIGWLALLSLITHTRGPNLLAALLALFHGGH